MTQASDFDKTRRDLLFELDGERHPKFLILVCDDAIQRTELNAEIDDRLAQIGRQIIYVHAASLGNDLIGVLSEQFTTENLGALSLSGIDTLDYAAATRLFAQLNFHRDWLGKLDVPIIIWISTELLSQLVNIAPDFWSRRSAVYYFSGQPFDHLLARLFAQARDKGQKWIPEPALSDALEAILTSEKELATRLRDKSLFSLTNIDSLILGIKGGVYQLVEECNKGRQIEVALWLWNLTDLDNELQLMLDNLDSEQRSRFESLYTDRNEVLLHLSERLIELLKQYLETLEAHIRNKKRVSLVLRARRIAISEIRKMAEALISSVEISLSSDIEEFDEYYSGLLESSRLEPQGNTFLAQAADDLEGWLSGHSNRLPPFFTGEEATLLRLLYSNQTGNAAIANALGISVSKVTEKVRFLERKVRLYLGLPPRLKAKRRPSPQPSDLGLG